MGGGAGGAAPADASRREIKLLRDSRSASLSLLCPSRAADLRLP